MPEISSKAGAVALKNLIPSTGVAWAFLITTIASVYSNSFKSESIGMIIFNSTNTTTIDHRRPVTNVKRVVDSVADQGSM